jgi:hypothetical protein
VLRLFLKQPNFTVNESLYPPLPRQRPSIMGSAAARHCTLVMTMERDLMLQRRRLLRKSRHDNVLQIPFIIATRQTDYYLK